MRKKEFLTNSENWENLPTWKKIPTFISAVYRLVAFTFFMILGLTFIGVLAWTLLSMIWS